MSTFIWWADQVRCISAFRAKLNTRPQLLRITRRASMVFLPVAAILVGSCSDTTAPGNGQLDVLIQVLGNDKDDDGFTLTLDSGKPIAVDRFTTRFDSVSAGEHVVVIDGVAGNCVLDGSNSRVVQVATRSSAEVRFAVMCEFTGIRVTTRTTGNDQPPAYALSVDQSAGLIPSNGSGTFTRLVPGKHTVKVSSVSANCSPNNVAPASVDVSNRTVTEIAFDFNCGRATNRIAFVLDSGTRNGLVDQYVVISNADAPGSIPIAQGYGPSWSPGGADIAYSNARCFDSYYYGFYCTGGLSIVDVATRSSIAIKNSDRGTSPAWSPDGRTIAFTRAQSNKNGLSTLELVGIGGDSTITLALPNSVDPARPSWSPDGQRIVFQCTYLTVPNPRPEICVISRLGTDLVRLITDGTKGTSPSWSPHGSLIAFATSMFSPESFVAVMTPDGAGITRVTSGSAPSWSPDGSTLLFEGSNGLFMSSVDGSNLTRVTTGRHHSPVWRK